METASGTSRASISPVSVDQRSVSTRPRPSPWSRADWLDWRLVQSREPTVGWAWWETLKNTHTAGPLDQLHPFHTYISSLWCMVLFFFLLEKLFFFTNLPPWSWSPWKRTWALTFLLTCVILCVQYVYCISRCPSALTYEACALGVCKHVTVINLFFLSCQQTQCIFTQYSNGSTIKQPILHITRTWWVVLF